MSVFVEIANGMIEVRVVNLAECLVAIEWRSSWKKTKMHYVITPKQGEGNMSREKLTFVIFLIHQLAEAWGNPLRRSMKALLKSIFWMNTSSDITTRFILWGGSI